MSDGTSIMRDVRDHVLFEVATEVANRGMSFPGASNSVYESFNHHVLRGY